MFKRLVYVSFIVGGLAFVIGANSNTQVNIEPLDAAVKVLTPEKLHPLKTKIIMSRLKDHYRRPLIDDDFSKQVLEAYLESLDGNRSYFYRKDIEEFNQYKDWLDDALKVGDVSFAFDMYNLFRTRWNERYQFAATILDNPMNFNVDESFIYDREGLDWPKDKKEMNELWRKRVKSDLLNLVLAGKEQEQATELLKKRYESHIRRLKQTKNEDVFEAYMNSVSRTVEPHTAYFSPRTQENFDIDMSLKLEGIGAVLQSDDVYTKINELVVGGPAFKSKQLKINDKIVGVGQGELPVVDVVGWRLDDVVKLIRGPAGSTVRLEVIADAAEASESKVVIIERDEIKLEDKAAKSEVIEQLGEDGKVKRIGVINIPRFYLDFEAYYRNDENYRSTTRDVKKLITGLEKQNIDGLLIDLRNNGGGALHESIELTGLFIDKGPVVQQRSSSGRIRVMSDTNEGVFYDGPLAVLINGYSASASEIFAAAIQDYGRGIILGEQTFGKGTVQTVFDLNQAVQKIDETLGAFKYTNAKFYRVNGGATQHKGVIPDISFPSAFDALEFGESAQKNALPWDDIESATFTPLSQKDFQISKLEQSFKQRIKDNVEFQFLQQDIEEYNRRKNDKEISLNKEKRIKERDQRKAESLARVNLRRKNKALAPVKSLDDVDDNIDKIPDYKLTEAVAILADYIHIKYKQQIANR
jgi:carboxyl-terminal processing protease